MDDKFLITDSVLYERAESLAVQSEGFQLIDMTEFNPVNELEKDLKIFDYDKDKNEADDSFLLIHTSGDSSSAPNSVWHANRSLLGSASAPNNQTTITCGLL